MGHQIAPQVQPIQFARRNHRCFKSIPLSPYYFFFVAPSISLFPIVQEFSHQVHTLEIALKIKEIQRNTNSLVSYSRAFWIHYRCLCDTSNVYIQVCMCLCLCLCVCMRFFYLYTPLKYSSGDDQLIQFPFYLPFSLLYVKISIISSSASKWVAQVLTWK